MISKVQQKKDKQGFTKDPACCKNCAYFRKITTDRILANGHEISKEIRRCGFGGFAVNPGGHCYEFNRRIAAWAAI